MNTKRKPRDKVYCGLWKLIINIRDRIVRTRNHSSAVGYHLDFPVGALEQAADDLATIAKESARTVCMIERLCPTSLLREFSDALEMLGSFSGEPWRLHSVTSRRIFEALSPPAMAVREPEPEEEADERQPNIFNE